MQKSKELELAGIAAGLHMMQPHKATRADELIACLEGEIAKRDEELAACLVAVENCEMFRARIAELEAERNRLLDAGQRVDDHYRSQMDAKDAELATPAPIPDAGELERLVTEQVKHAYYERKTITEAVGEIVSALQDSAMVVPDGWIAVSDRLPDETHAYGCHTDDVLCLTRARKHVIAMLAHTTTGAVWFDQQSQERDITHWMPLPTAPGGGQ